MKQAMWNWFVRAQLQRGSPYDPIANITSVDTSTNATQASLDLADVQAFGVWMETTVATNTGYRLSKTWFGKFQAGAIVITYCFINQAGLVR